MAVLCIDRKGGETKISLVDYRTGKVQLLARRRAGRAAQSPQLSTSNGVIGTEARLRAEMALDARLGVPIRYVKTAESRNYKGQRVCAWRAEFESRSQKNRWLCKRKRVDLDAGYGDPAPGDFSASLPKEFE